MELRNNNIKKKQINKRRKKKNYKVVVVCVRNVKRKLKTSKVRFFQFVGKTE